MKENMKTSYASNSIGSGIYCECGKELTHEQNQGNWNRGYKTKMCVKCMNEYCSHAITGE